jgi:hypothetical protein
MASLQTPPIIYSGIFIPCRIEAEKSGENWLTLLRVLSATAKIKLGGADG